MDTSKATARPWKVGYSDGSGMEFITVDDDAVATVVWGCSCCKPEVEPKDIKRAELIVQAVNSYDRMREALRVIANQSLGEDWTAEQAINFAKEHARAALEATNG